MTKLLLTAYIVFLSLISPIVIHATVISGSSVYDAYGDDSFLFGYDDSTINIYPESTISWLYGYDNTNINISGGDISWLKVYDQSVTNITSIDYLSWLLVSDTSEVNIFGSDFSYINGQLSGVWQNGESFSFWALDESNLYSGGSFDILPENINLHPAPVPEPSTILLFLMGIAVVSYAKMVNVRSLSNLREIFANLYLYKTSNKLFCQ